MAMRVLLVEDNAGYHRLIQELLKEGMGEQVDLEWTDRLSTALTRLENGKIDVVLLDLAGYRTRRAWRPSPGRTSMRLTFRLW